LERAEGACCALLTSGNSHARIHLIAVALDDEWQNPREGERVFPLTHLRYEPSSLLLACEHSDREALYIYHQTISMSPLLPTQVDSPPSVVVCVATRIRVLTAAPLPNAIGSWTAFVPLYIAPRMVPRELSLAARRQWTFTR
jgi:hypothetical protein